MLALLFSMFLVLVAAGTLLLFDLRGEGLEATSGWAVVQAVLYGMAAVTGSALLVALLRGEGAVVLALAPLTGLSFLRFSLLARRWWKGWRHVLFVTGVFALGLVLSLRWLPVPLNRTVLLEGVHREVVLPAPPSIDPSAERAVRA
ncbi:MAG TPA: hypothetical protein VD962_07820 [Rubricoccaceae bacterium]|nr:hypothetical protein [Rubricoccaceae bacterium]